MRTGIKLLFLVSQLQTGGSERTVTYLSSYLAKRQFDVTILSLSDDIFYKQDEQVKVQTLNIESKAKNIWGRIWLARRRFLEVKQYLQKNKFDIVFCILPEMARYLLKIHKKAGFCLITSERNNPAVVTQKHLLKLKHKIYQESDGIVFQTQRAMDFYPESIRKKGVVIHNAVGNPYVYQVPEIQNRKPKISAMGRLVAQKDYHTLIRAFQPVALKYPAYRLEIFGKGDGESELKALVEELDLAEKVCFCGDREDAVLKIADSACYVMSSKHEGMPNALMEAMAVGLPCVSTDCPNGPAELIKNGENGLLVPVGDVEALTAAMFTMIERKTFANKCGKNAKRILETHSIEKNAKAYLDYILKIYDKDE